MFSDRKTWLEDRLVEFFRVQKRDPATVADFWSSAMALAPQELAPPERDDLGRELLTLLEASSALGSIGAEHRAKTAAVRSLEISGFHDFRYVGRGGMAEVWKARQVDPERDVAIKIPLGLTADEYRRLGREADVLARLQHPGIVAIHELITLASPSSMSPTPCLVMEWVDGVTLDKACATFSGQSPPIATCVDWLLATLDALAYAHGLGVLHRDLKPGNLMLDAAGQIRVVDFGLARAADQSSLTASGELLGTPQYLAPELGSGGDFTPRSDLWALGAVLYELLAGCRPYAGIPSHEHQLDPPSLGTRRSGLPRELVAIVDKSTAAEPGRRYSTARAFRDDLAEYRRGGMVTARTNGSFERLLRRVRSRPAPTIAAATIVGLLILLLATLTVSQASRRQADHFRAVELVQSALLWELADAPLNGEVVDAIQGRTEAIAQLEQATNLASEMFSAQVHLAVLHADLGNWAHAAAATSRARRLRPHHRLIAWLDGRIASNEIGDIEAPGESQLDTDWAYYLGRQLARRNQREAALPLLIHAATDSVYAAAALAWQGTLHMRGRRNPELAFGALAGARSRMPNHPVLVHNTVVSLLDSDAREGREERLTEATNLLRAARHAHPTSGLLAYSEGLLAYKRDDLRGSIRALEEAVVHLPERSGIVSMLGQAWLQLGAVENAPPDDESHRQARHWLEQAMQLGADDVTRFRLACCLVNQGDVEAGKRELGVCAESRNDGVSRAARQALERLR